MKRSLIILCAILFISVNSYAAAPLLHVSSDNPRYFADPSGNIVYLRGLNTNDGYEFQDHAFGGTSLSDFSITLNMYAANNLNLIRMWVSENSGPGPNTPAPLPWARSTVCCAADGGAKFDLTQFNVGDLVTPHVNSLFYFERLRARAIASGNANIYMAVMLWHSFGWENGTQRLAGNQAWQYHPLNAANNVQNLNCDTNGNGWGDDLGVLNNYCQYIQDAYVRQVIDSVNDLDNILYEICNECYGGGTYVNNYPWQNAMANLIKDYELTKPKQHLVGITSDHLYNNSAMVTSNAHWMGYAGLGEWNTPSVATGQRVSIQDIDHIAPCVNNNLYWPWKSFTRGHNPLYFYCGPFGSPTSTEQSLITRVGQTATYAAKLNLKTAVPMSSCSTTFCIGSNGQYLAYLPTGGSVSFNLSGTNAYTVEWFNPSTNQVLTPSSVNPGSQTFTTPWTGTESVLLVKDSGVAPPPPTRVLTPLLKAFPDSVTITAPQGTNGYGSFELQKSSSTTSSYYISTNRGWIWLNPPYGSTQSIATEVDLIEINAQTSGLAVGTYTGVVWIVESGPQGNQTLTIPVTYNVTTPGSNPPPPPPSPAIGLSPTTLGFNIQEGGSSLSQNITLSNTVSGSTLVWSVSDNATWLSVSPSNGTNNATLVATVNPSGLSVGTYTAAITITGNGATNTPQTVNVNLTITAAPPATLTLKQALQNAIDQCQALTTCTGKDFSDKLEPLLNQVP